MAFDVLTDAQAAHFVAQGYVKLEGCFEKAAIQDWLDLAYVRLGYDRDDPSTWREDRIHMPSMNRRAVAEFAPKAWGGICDVMGGADRIEGEPSWGDGFIINFHKDADDPWTPSATRGGWHKDGNFFRHFLDSPEQGLLTVVVWDDVLPNSGGTYLAPESIPKVARYLYAHPEGLEPGAFGKRIEGCEVFVEATGRAGDVYLIHPYMLHSVAPNPSGRPRFITNPPVAFKEPMNFNREDAEDFSLVEKVVLNALGVERLDYQIAGERERYYTEFRRERERMLEEQKARLAALTRVSSEGLTRCASAVR